MIDGVIREVVIGHARLIYGDARIILPLLDPVEALVTDPPYGMKYRSKQPVHRARGIDNDHNASALQWAAAIEASHSKYIFCRWDNIADIPKPKSLITWIKNNWSRGDLRHEHARQTEVLAFYPGRKHFFPGPRPQDVVFASRILSEAHPTEKPVSLMMDVVGWTHGLVVDPFMGSGSTGVACAKLGREFIGIELNERYFRTACRRIREAAAQPQFFVREAQATIPSQLNLFIERGEALQ